MGQGLRGAREGEELRRELVKLELRIRHRAAPGPALRAAVVKTEMGLTAPQGCLGSQGKRVQILQGCS